jgi:hypothetical protein
MPFVDIHENPAIGGAIVISDPLAVHTIHSYYLTRVAAERPIRRAQKTPHDTVS